MYLHRLCATGITYSHICFGSAAIVYSSGWEGEGDCGGDGRVVEEDADGGRRGGGGDGDAFTSMMVASLHAQASPTLEVGGRERRR